MKKLAIIFPGVGYTKDRPLLYYAGKLAMNYGYELIHLDFSGISWSKEKLKDHNFLLKTLEDCIQRTEKALSEQAADKADEVIFISKSIGTVVATAYAKKMGLNVRQICFTPLEFIQNFIEEENGLIFYGSGDPYANPEAIAKICKDKKLEAYCIKDANHSLETGNVALDLTNLQSVMQKVEDKLADKNLYTFPVQQRDGSITNLSEYRGEVLLIVNTATGCGFTPQYEALEQMYHTYHKDGFEVLDFPCNQFGRQAPGTSAEIFSFCTARYDISFPQYKKIEVNGENELELYTYLKSKQGFHGFGDSPDAAYMKKKLEQEAPDYETTPDIKWNFTKFLVSRKGEVVARFEPTEDMKMVEEAVKRELDND